MQSRKIFLALLVSLVLLSGSQADDRAAELDGLRSLHVIVTVCDQFKTYGLDGSAIQTDLELGLRSVGIAVVSEADADAVLTLRVECLAIGYEQSPTQYAFTARIEIFQAVFRSTAIFWMLDAACSSKRPLTVARCDSLRESLSDAYHPRATIWDKGYFGLRGTKTIAEMRVEVVKDLCNGFMNAYLAANPKPR